MKKTNMMSLAELGEIMSTELRGLNQVDINDRFISKIVDKAKQIFNIISKISQMSKKLNQPKKKFKKPIIH